jgi:hypothetical protein
MLSRSELSDLIESYLQVFHAAARYTCAVRAEELRDEIAHAWLMAYIKRPERALRVFEQPDCNVLVWAKWRAAEIVRHWLRDEEESLEAILDSVEHAVLVEPEWPSAPQTQRGPRERGDYLADRDDLHRLFTNVARRSDLETPDLMDAFQCASPADQTAIARLASGYSKSEMGSWAYGRARAQLQTAV